MKKIRHSHRLRIGTLEALEGRTLLSVVVPTGQGSAPSAAIARADTPRAGGPLKWTDYKATTTAPAVPSAVPTADTTPATADTTAPPAETTPVTPQVTVAAVATAPT